MHEANGDGALFSLETPGTAESELEREVKASIAAIDRVKPIDATRRALCFIAVELARNISSGNRKGRAISNEAAQLTATLELIQGKDADAGGADQLPPDVKEFLNALSATPVAPVIAAAGPAPLRDTA